MKIRPVLASFLVAVFATASAAYAQSDAQTVVAEPPQLIAGRVYDISVERHGVKERCRGVFVRIADDWIVLGQLRCETEEVGTPPPSHMPLARRLFQKPSTVQVYTKIYFWIPRAATHIDRYVGDPDERFKDLFRDDAPVIQPPGVVHWAAEKGAQPSRLKELKEDGLSVVTQTQEHRVVETSKLSKLPVVGAAFVRHENVVHETENRLAADDVLFIETEVNYEPPAAKGAAKN